MLVISELPAVAQTPIEALEPSAPGFSTLEPSAPGSSPVKLPLRCAEGPEPLDTARDLLQDRRATGRSRDGRLDERSRQVKLDPVKRDER